MKVTAAWEFARTIVDDWFRHEVPRLGAALAFYALFSMAPLLVIVVAIVSFLYQGDTAAEVQNKVAALIGHEAARTVGLMIHNANTIGSGMRATVIGLGFLFVGATLVFSELRVALNKIWDVSPPTGIAIWQLIKERVTSFVMVLAIAFVLLMSMVATTVLAAINAYLSAMVPEAEGFWYLLDLAVSPVLGALLFAMLFRYVPDVRIPWKDVWIGAAVTAVLFSIGTAILGRYLGQTSFTSAFGAASSLVVILLWVYYSSQIVFFGAEFTRIYSNMFGSNAARNKPLRGAA
jgi:membrane protein